MKSYRFGTILTILALSGCSYYNPKDIGTTPGTATTGYNAISYGQVRDQVFTPKCISCHSSGDQSPALDSYAAVKAALGDIQQMALVKRAMPPRKPLPSDLSSLLNEWIAAGAPLGNSTPPSPTPSAEPSAVPSSEPTLLPLAPTFVSIRADIFEPKCAKCHSPGGKAEDVPLDTINDLLSNKLITVGNASTSKLYTLVANKKMPPKSTGKTLTDQEIQTISDWIQQGAPE